MLHAYRVNCALTKSSGLILPEALKMAPLYCSAIMKLPAFRRGSDVRADEKSAWLLKLLGFSVMQTARLLYPRVFPLVEMSERAGRCMSLGDSVHLPKQIPCSMQRLPGSGAYVI